MNLLPLPDALLAILVATGYLTYVLVNESGPLRLFERIRDLPFSIGEMASCVICAPFWTGMVVLAASVHLPVLVDVLALAGIVAGGLRLWAWISKFLELLSSRFYLSNAQQVRDQEGDLTAENYLKHKGSEVSVAMTMTELLAEEAQKAN